MPRDPFPKVKEARDAARARALEILDDFQSTIKLAVAAGDYEAAMSSFKWLLEHMPADEDGTKVIDTSVDNRKQVEGPVGPQINLGFQISGLGAQPQVAVVEPEQSAEKSVLDVKKGAVKLVE